MCRWGCATVDTTHMCKWCGTRYCRECLRGEFYGLMIDPTTCKKCFQHRCQGPRVDYFPPAAPPDNSKGSKGRGRGAVVSKKTTTSESFKKKPTVKNEIKKKTGGKKKKKKKTR